MDVTVLHLMPTLMERQLDPAAGHLLQRAIEARGIKVITRANTKAIVGNGRVEAVELEDGTQAARRPGGDGGRHPPQRAARQGRGTRRSIAASWSMPPCAPAIPTSSRWANAPRPTARCSAWWRRSTRWPTSSAAQLAGDGEARFRSSATATKLKVTGINLFSAGDFAEAKDREEIVLRDATRGQSTGAWC